jgi:hypothetical protein
LNKILVPILVATISLLFAPGLANAEIKVTPPTNWQASPDNNSTQMVWSRNSTKSFFAIAKPPLNFPFPLFFVGPMVAHRIADEGLLESTDQITFGRSNYGYRYLINLSSASDYLNSYSGLIQESGILDQIPKETDVPLRGMLILTQKEDQYHLIFFLNPRENFLSVLNELKPTLDSIQLSNSPSTR